MIEHRQGDILQADAEALVNTVNCVGVMGRGIALQFRRAFPENYDAYRAVCQRGELRPGMVLTHDLGRLHNPRYVINFPTKRHWRGNSRLEDIEAGLAALVEEVKKKGIRSVAIPPLGSGLGGLDWRQVRPRIEAAFRELTQLRVLLYEPAGAPEPGRMARPQIAPRMTPGRAVLLELMRRYLSAVMDPSISLLEIQKLLYFQQEGGEPLRLRYSKHYYGPYAANLRHLLSHVEGFFIRGFGDGDDRPDKQIQLLPEAAAEAKGFLADHPETRIRFDRVAELIEGFETPYGMELLATVHWVATREAATTAGEAIDRTYSWSSRKKMFREEHIRMAWDVLCEKGWIEAIYPTISPTNRSNPNATTA
ncbi:MAG: macro domain-containing protein [Thermoanaerobaculia bacterium]|nr:macro domain-containing protein [Thermoanaerobaculia bacterium]